MTSAHSFDTGTSHARADASSASRFGMVALTVAGGAAVLAGCFTPLFKDSDYRLVDDVAEVAPAAFVAAGVAFIAAAWSLRGPVAAAGGLLMGAGLVSAAFFASDFAIASAAIGTFLGLGGSLAMVGAGGWEVLASRDSPATALAWPESPARQSAAADTPQAPAVVVERASEPAAAAAAPGWYADPARRASLRYWDGASWTERTKD